MRLSKRLNQTKSGAPGVEVLSWEENETVPCMEFLQGHINRRKRYDNLILFVAPCSCWHSPNCHMSVFHIFPLSSTEQLQGILAWAEQHQWSTMILWHQLLNMNRIMAVMRIQFHWCSWERKKPRQCRARCEQLTIYVLKQLSNYPIIPLMTVLHKCSLN